MSNFERLAQNPISPGDQPPIGIQFAEEIGIISEGVFQNCTNVYYNLFVGIILQFIFSGKCKADSACDKTTGKCLDDTGCAKGKLDFISVSWKKLYFFMETNDIFQDIVETIVWHQIAP